MQKKPLCRTLVAADSCERGGRFIRAEGRPEVRVSRPSGTGRNYEFHWHGARADPCG